MDVVTGALGFTGRYIAAELLARGRGVTTLVSHLGRPNPFGHRLRVAPLDFANYPGLVESLRGADTLYITYWVRFAHGGTTFNTAVANSESLVRAAREAGVRRLVHVSVSNPSLGSPLPYFRGKAAVEEAIKASGLSYAIVRPTLTFGPGDVLVNNIAWLLRRFPVFAIAGRGDYRLQPVHVEDVAALAVDLGPQADNTVVDAAGPDVFTYEQLVRLLARAVGSRAILFHLPPALLPPLAALIGRLVRDVLLTREELPALMANLLVSTSPPTGKTRLSEWLAQYAECLGVEYASEMRRHFR